MNRLNAFTAVSCLSLAGFAMLPQARAAVWNKRTIMTVHETIQVPGAVLKPGKYVMKLHDSPSNRHIVQIFNEREDRVLTTILAIPHYRMQPTDKTEFRFWEVPAGDPKALRAWFYPGDNTGQEFVYRKGFAVRIAQQTHTEVPAVLAETEAELETAPVKIVDETGIEKELKIESYAHQELPARQFELALATPPVEFSPVPETTEHHSLPETSSLFPMIGLAGLLALGSGVALRAISRRDG